MVCYAFVCGNPWRLIYGTDCFGNVCGSQNRRIPMRDFEVQAMSGSDMRSKPFLFYYYPEYPKLSRSVCVERCPDEFINEDLSEFLAYQNRSGLNLCDYALTPQDILSHVNERLFGAAGRCPVLPIYPQRSLFRRCVPALLHNEYRSRSFDVYSSLGLSNAPSAATNNSLEPAARAPLRKQDADALNNIFGFFNEVNSISQQVYSVS